MKVKELMELLGNVNQELDVVICVAESGVEAYEVYDMDGIDMGWEPSGAVTLNTGRMILE
jgi:hypothetical protein